MTCLLLASWNPRLARSSIQLSFMIALLVDLHVHGLSERHAHLYAHVYTRGLCKLQSCEKCRSGFNRSHLHCVFTYHLPAIFPFKPCVGRHGSHILTHTWMQLVSMHVWNLFLPRPPSDLNSRQNVTRSHMASTNHIPTCMHQKCAHEYAYKDWCMYVRPGKSKSESGTPGPARWRVFCIYVCLYVCIHACVCMYMYGMV